MTQPPKLPGPFIDRWEWQLGGLCRGDDTGVFFSADGERGAARAYREMRAKKMCSRCPVIAECRAYALSVGEPYGVWGGLSASDREKLAMAAERQPGLKSEDGSVRFRSKIEQVVPVEK
ncbi:WhiB family transcriptional regulator [Mycolicibacterium goodii]|uniref:Transcriptional regulator WhiB n=1 Tax=Mycolicibacterium goodii TaxID=134601 RepID=A0ABS6HYL6_MYCGD|nr:WhiB family transcriptional regulator [Mycolicibacterium goodii]MBU8827758.1 WhiB family transcriptional regulator [Mycolicibacterium goodii]MBU8841666.1 WhiB family transcriptional regulator [Mycolicibacterium goodii]